MQSGTVTSSKSKKGKAKAKTPKPILVSSDLDVGTNGDDGPSMTLVPAGDEIVETPSEGALRDRLRAARTSIVTCMTGVAQDLHRVVREQLFKKWGYKNFGDYVETEVDFERRKADYLIAAWQKFGVTLAETRPDAPELLAELGWVRSAAIAPVLADDGSNLDEWAEQARDMTVRELTKAVKKARGKKSSDGDDEFVTKHFKLAPAQLENVESALNMASEAAESDKPGHLLDLICTRFLATTDPERFLDEAVASLEEGLGLKIVVIDPEKGTIVYGQNHIEDLKAG